MGFREQAAAIPRVWIAPIPAAAARVATGEWVRAGCKNFTANCLRPTTAPDVTTGKNRKSPGNRRKNSSGSDLLYPTYAHGPLSLSQSSPSRAPSFGSTLESFFFFFFTPVSIVIHVIVGLLSVSSFFPSFFFFRARKDVSRNVSNEFFFASRGTLFNSGMVLDRGGWEKIREG